MSKRAEIGAPVQRTGPQRPPQVDFTPAYPDPQPTPGPGQRLPPGGGGGQRECYPVEVEGIIGPIAWHQEATGTIEFSSESGQRPGRVETRGLMPVEMWQNFWIRFDSIMFSLNDLTTAIPVTIEFVPASVEQDDDDGPRYRILSPTSEGGADVRTFVGNNGGAGWPVPVSDHGDPWALRCITAKSSGAVDTTAHFWAWYTLVPRFPR